MEASFSDLGKKSRDILRALDRNETVTLLYRGKPKAIMQPLSDQPTQKAADHPAFGMWADREDLQEEASHVRGLRADRQ